MQFCNLFVIIRPVIITFCNFLERVTFIFKNFNIRALINKVRSYDVFNKVVEFLKNNRVLVRISAVCLVGMLSVGIAVSSTGITLGFDVKYSGKKIATVRNQTVVKQAEKIAATNVSGKAAKKAIKHPELSLTLTVRDKLDNADTVADAIINNTDKIISASVLTVNGERIVCAATEELTAAIEARKNQFVMSGAANQASFVDKVEIVKGYYLKKDIENSQKVAEVVATLAVKNVATITVDTVIPYKTQNNYTAARERGYYKIVSAGKNGLTRTTEQIETLNGAETQRIVLENQVIAEPVNRVVTVGTAPVYVSESEYAKITAAGFIRPLANISRAKVTSDFGYRWGKTHKGIDIDGDTGDAIFAVAAGTVINSGWHSSYGYNITIDHGNGLQTRYAHASALYVKKGETVYQGEMIAAVGNTGYSTGSHLHFEVIVNGTHVNPAPYISLN